MIGSRTRALLVAGPAVVMVLGACFLPIHIGTENRNRSFARACICPDGVAVFDNPAAVKQEYVKVAELIPPPGGAEYMPNPMDVLNAQRKKAAQLGANGLVVQPGQRRNDGFYDNALAIFIPEDTGRVLAACQTKL